MNLRAQIKGISLGRLANSARSLVPLACCLMIFGCGVHEADTGEQNPSPLDVADKRPTELVASMDAVKPFFSALSAPGPMDWLANFNEPGQTFAEYLVSDPTVPTDERKTIYVLPLGSFTEKENDAIQVTSEYLQAFYGLTVKSLPRERIKRPLRLKDGRVIGTTKKEQVRTGYILNDVLKPTLPKDAAALIAFTNEDLYPDSSMYFVFGQASMEDRVGVWSLYRLQENGDLRTFLLRTIKIATHETGHMFSMHHCTAYSCVMSGTNHLGETDGHPIDACPECMAKVCWFSHVSPAERYRRLEKVCRENGLTKEADEFQKKFEAVGRVT